MTAADRQRQGVVTLGGTQQPAPRPFGRLMMRSLDERPPRRLAYNVPGDELRRVAVSARPIRVAQVASA